MPSRGLAARQAVTRTTESPYRTITAPSACLASLPVSMDSGLLDIEISRVVINALSGPRDPKGPRGPMGPKTWLFSDVEALDQIGVPMRILRLQVIEQTAAAADEHQQATPRVVVLGVCLEVFGEVVDAFAENRDLHFGRAGIAVVGLVVADQLGL